MKRRIRRFIGFCLCGWSMTVQAGNFAEMECGTPFLMNYPAEIYGAHDRNADVVCDNHGNCYFANLEGILKYDGQTWNMITTPGISRSTALAVGRDGKVYAGGYQVAGVLEENGNGGMVFKAYVSDSGTEGRRIGEVRTILESDGKVIFVARNALVVVDGDSVDIIDTQERLLQGFYLAGGVVLETEDGKLMAYRSGEWKDFDRIRLRDVVYTTFCELPDGRLLMGTNRGLFVAGRGYWNRPDLIVLPDGVAVNQILQVTDEVIVVATATHGVLLLDDRLTLRGRVDESRGLCSSVVNALAYDGKGSLWLATGHGVARVLIASMYSLFSENEGLPGEVLSVLRHRGILYAGTYRGLFFLAADGCFRKIEGIAQACWQLAEDPEGYLWAATGNGLFRIDDGMAQAFGNSYTMSLVADAGPVIYTGEQDAVYRIEPEKGIRKLVAGWGQVNRLMVGTDGNVWMSTIFGEVGTGRLTDTIWDVRVVNGVGSASGNQICEYKGQTVIVSENGFYHRVDTDRAERFFPVRDSMPRGWWPGVCIESGDYWWMTRGDGKEVAVFQEGHRLENYSQRLRAVATSKIRVIYPEKNGVTWLGGSFGLIRADLEKNDPVLAHIPVVYIRKVVRQANQPRNVGFTFATDAAGVISPVEYSCRLAGFEREWGEWQEEGCEEYLRLPYGKYVFQVRVRDVFGRISDVTEVQIEIPSPFYWSGYAWCVYGLMAILLVVGVVRWRVRKLLKEKERLETLVADRTQEIRQQRDEIREKSESLENTLAELGKAQHELIRQEKMATVGKLTQGLVDRILNPLNYIGNFALLSKNLSSEAVQILCEGGQESWNETKNELVEVMGMLELNLEKIVGHGESTARILKAMEEILKERFCVLLPEEMNILCQENLEIFKEYWKSEISEKGVRINFEGTSGEIIAQVDKKQFRKVLLSILNNGMAAVLKKTGQETWVPEVSLKLERQENGVRIMISDNGMGIEIQVLDKVFDPFFTTRTTAEAAGVGLFLSREVVLNHGGRIGIESEKGEWTRVWIEL